MEIEQYKEKKKELDEKILALIRQFEDETTCIVEDIELKNACHQGKDGLVKSTCYVFSNVRVC